MSQSTMPAIALVTVCALVTAGCSQPASEDVAAAPAPAAAAVEPSDAASPPVSWEKDGLTVTSLPGSPQFPGASLSLDGAEGSLDPGLNAFHFGVESYELGTQTSDAGANGLANSAQGQHIHLILNNGPYSAHYEPHVEKELTDGHYVLLAFLSRSYHESVKEPSAVVLRQFSVGEGEYEEADLAAPHLFYSRPKGTYKGADTERLMLDFYLVNTTISADGNRVRATVNGTEFEFTEWVPYVIEGLQPGEVEITLELIDAAGDPVPGPFNSVTRSVTLEADEVS